MFAPLLIKFVRNFQKINFSDLTEVFVIFDEPIVLFLFLKKPLVTTAKHVMLLD
jgi:hypothetical protein